MKCDSSDGHQIWTRHLGTTAADVGAGVSVNMNDGYIYVTGNTFGSFDGNISASGLDVFLLQYNSSGAKQ
jgi:hypothetical protein